MKAHNHAHTPTAVHPLLPSSFRCLDGVHVMLWCWGCAGHTACKNEGVWSRDITMCCDACKFVRSGTLRRALRRTIHFLRLCASRTSPLASSLAYHTLFLNALPFTQHTRPHSRLLPFPSPPLDRQALAVSLHPRTSLPQPVSRGWVPIPPPNQPPMAHATATLPAQHFHDLPAALFYGSGF